MSSSRFVGIALLPLALACSANSSDNTVPGGGGNAGNGGSSGNGASSGGGSINLDGGQSDGAINTPPPVGNVFGTVLAPEGTIPISGALVYLTSDALDEIPDNVYCDECVKLGPDDPYTFSNADGSFDLPTWRTGNLQLVVRKGQFRQVTRIDVTEGDQYTGQFDARLPIRGNPAEGDTIPKMAVIQGAWDGIEVTLAKLGLGTVVNQGPLIGDVVDPATASFDIITNGASILTDWNRLSQYHVVFLPCSGNYGGGTEASCTDDPMPDNPQVQDNLRRFVREGGKLYVTDYSYEYVRRPWPGFYSWQNESSTSGSACLDTSHTEPATVHDPGMQAWLAAQGINHFEIEANWTRINAVLPGQALDEDGNPTTVTPTTWVSGSTPATVSFQDQCGRVLFSTYHTEGDGSGTLIPQEKALLYVLLEVGVCIGQLPPPPVR